MAARYDVVDPADALLNAAREPGIGALIVENSSHFSGIANRVLGEVLAKALLEQ